MTTIFSPTLQLRSNVSFHLISFHLTTSTFHPPLSLAKSSSHPHHRQTHNGRSQRRQPKNIRFRRGCLRTDRPAAVAEARPALDMLALLENPPAFAVSSSPPAATPAPAPIPRLLPPETRLYTRRAPVSVCDSRKFSETYEISSIDLTRSDFLSLLPSAVQLENMSSQLSLECTRGLSKCVIWGGRAGRKRGQMR